jgi:hypothetical protein
MDATCIHVWLLQTNPHPNPNPHPHPIPLRWGYSVAALRVGVKHFAWQQIQIEPSAAWHQDINSQES